MVKDPEKFSAAARILSREVVFDGYHRLENVTAEPRSLKHDGWAAPVSREVFYCKKVACVLPYIPETDEVLLNQQFRLGALMAGAEDPFLFEIAAGGLDEGESAESAARREAQEETGCEVTALEPIGICYPSTGSLAEEYRLFVGRIVRAEAGIYGQDHEGEEIKTHLLSAKEAIRMLDEGRVTNSAAMVALHWLARHRDSLRRKWVGGFEI